jgi:MBG domain (YGX type)
VSATYARVAGENASPPTYHITATLSATVAGALDNYIITNTGAEFTIDRATLDITANNQGKIYGNTFTFAGTEFTAGVGQLKFSDAVTSATLTSAGAGATATYTAPGPNYAINITAAVFSPGSAGNNYNITYHSGTLTLSQRQLDITANNRTKTYGATVTFAGTEFSTGAGQLVNGNTVTSVTLTSAGAAATATVTAPGPNYPIAPTAAVGTGLGNYSVSYHDGNLHIDPAALTITATNRSKVFGATYTPDTTIPPASVDFNVTGLVNSDTVTSITLTCAGYAAAALPSATPYPVVPSAAVGTGLGNYTIGYLNGQFTIGYGACSGGYTNAQIQQPVNSDGSSVVKVGSTVPVKFTVCGADGQPIFNHDAVFGANNIGTIRLLSAVRGTVDNINETPYIDVADVAFRWATDKWIFNMATNNLQKNTTYRYQIPLADGSYIQFQFGTK